ncbi:hypothetical protein AVEN_63268-1 [Araneus ventricosus]|uniref:Uncharacterized protein n=1 Tax=Araneus ventricosus TaxID=182803 RepID=A0A4Y2K424_ARAVE|nr:hypothetical protein AVEN_63268-1 [Araneus ventricosus]
MVLDNLNPKTQKGRQRKPESVTDAEAREDLFTLSLLHIIRQSEKCCFPSKVLNFMEKQNYLQTIPDGNRTVVKTEREQPNIWSEELGSFLCQAKKKTRAAR